MCLCHKFWFVSGFTVLTFAMFVNKDVKKRKKVTGLISDLSFFSGKEMQTADTIGLYFFNTQK